MTNTFSLTCAQCSGKIELQGSSPIVKCPYCGTELIILPDIARQILQNAALVCPICGQVDKLEKVSALVMKETGKTPSQLVKWLTLSEPDYHHVKMPDPPFPPRKKDAAAEAWFKELQGVYQNSMIIYERKRAANAHLRKQQEQRLTIWNELYYCDRDGCVCLPYERLFAEPQQTETFVNSQWDRRYNR